MCCFFTALVFFGPRLAVLVWWILDPTRWYGTPISAFQSWLWPLLGFVFLPWTTLMYVAVAPGGIVLFDWILLALALFIDIGSYGGSGWGNRNRLGYGS